MSRQSDQLAGLPSHEKGKSTKWFGKGKSLQLLISCWMKCTALRVAIMEVDHHLFVMHEHPSDSMCHIIHVLLPWFHGRYLETMFGPHVWSISPNDQAASIKPTTDVLSLFGRARSWVRIYICILYIQSIYSDLFSMLREVASIILIPVSEYIWI